jgi:hypothetical protein
MTMHESGLVRRSFDLEDANVFVFENEVVVGFVGDLDLGDGLGGEKGGEEERHEENRAFHGGGF